MEDFDPETYLSGRVEAPVVVNADANEGNGSRPRRPSLVWLGLGIVAVIIFELTAQPWVVVVIGCLKFGWDEQATARWLKRRDPNPIRGRICGRFYAAWALWKVSMVAMAMMFTLAIVSGQIDAAQGKPRQVQGNAPPPVFMSAFCVSILGFVLSAAMSTVAVFSAWRRGVRVWLGPEAKLARRADVWPPNKISLPSWRRKNRAGAVVLSALITILTLVAIFILTCGLSLPRTPLVFWMISVVVGLVLPVALLWSREFLLRRVAAQSIWQCWPSEGVTHGPV
jgi:hypothetical protein